MELSFAAVDWGVGPATYVRLWAAFLVAAVFVGAAIRMFVTPGLVDKLAGLVVALGGLWVMTVAGNEFWEIYRHASWPAFSWASFLLSGLPVIVPVIVVGWRRWWSLRQAA